MLDLPGNLLGEQGKRRWQFQASSNEGIIAKDGTITPPATQQVVDLVFTLSGNGGEADTVSIPVVIPAGT